MMRSRLSVVARVSCQRKRGKRLGDLDVGGVEVV